MIDHAVLRAMLNAGCTADQIVAVAEEAAQADEARRAAKRAGNAERQRRHRERNASSRVTGVTNGDTPSPKKEIPPTPPKEKTTPSQISVSGSAREREFSDFWAIYPNRVGKRDAHRAFDGARQRADLETILSGVRRYAAKTDDRPWCNPATFLNQDRWSDDPAAPQQAQPRAGAPPSKPLTQGESLRNMARQKGIIDDAGNPIRRLETSDRDGEDTGSGHVVRLAIAGNHGW